MFDISVYFSRDWGFPVKNANFWRNTKKTIPNIKVWPESRLSAMFAKSSQWLLIANRVNNTTKQNSKQIPHNTKCRQHDERCYLQLSKLNWLKQFWITFYIHTTHCLNTLRTSCQNSRPTSQLIMYRKQLDHDHPTGVNFGLEAFLEYSKIFVLKKVSCLCHYRW